MTAKGIDIMVKGNKTGLFYANRYCAECHSESFSYIPVDVLCRDETQEPFAPSKPTSESIPVILYTLLIEGQYKE